MNVGSRGYGNTVVVFVLTCWAAESPAGLAVKAWKKLVEWPIKKPVVAWRAKKWTKNN